jgi:hypothetical protein
LINVTPFTALQRLHKASAFQPRPVSQAHDNMTRQSFFSSVVTP